MRRLAFFLPIAILAFLLFSLPVVALHGEGTRCAGSARQAGDDDREEPPAETHRPFAQLQDLLKH